MFKVVLSCGNTTFAQIRKGKREFFLHLWNGMQPELMTVTKPPRLHTGISMHVVCTPSKANINVIIGKQNPIACKNELFKNFSAEGRHQIVDWTKSISFICKCSSKGVCKNPPFRKHVYVNVTQQMLRVTLQHKFDESSGRHKDYKPKSIMSWDEQRHSGIQHYSARRALFVHESRARVSWSSEPHKYALRTYFWGMKRLRVFLVHPGWDTLCCVNWRVKHWDKFPHSPILHYACGSMCVVLCFATKKQKKNSA